MVVGMVWPEAMSPLVYGDWAYSIELEMWALAFIVAPLLVIYGVHMNGRTPVMSALLRLVGHLGLLLLFGAIIASAATADHGWVIIIFGSVFHLDELAHDVFSDAELLWHAWGARDGPD